MTNTISIFKTIATNIVARIESEEKGHSLVETAVVLSFLLCMTFGLIDVSRCVYTSNVVNAAAQEGARAGIIDTSNIESTIENKMIGLDINSADINISVTGDIVEVEVAYNFEFITPLASTLVDSLALNGKASMVTM